MKMETTQGNKELVTAASKPGAHVFVDPRTGKGLNPMCESCACLHDSCDGICDLVYTGCIWQHSKQIQSGDYAQQSPIS